MIKIITVVGARPQFIKAANISRLIIESNGMEEAILHTGQHFDQNMSEIFFSELEIPTPKYNLGIGGGTHGQNTGRMIEGIERVLIEERPNFTLVYGDTDSTLAGALAAAKLHIPVFHVEAGLRSYNREMPEEINRVLTDHLSEVLFAPTNTAVNNLIKEGVANNKIEKVGDVMFDAALYYAKKADQTSNILSRLNINTNEYILATIHRAENTDNEERLSNIFKGLFKS